MTFIRSSFRLSFTLDKDRINKSRNICTRKILWFQQTFLFKTEKATRTNTKKKRKDEMECIGYKIEFFFS